MAVAPIFKGKVTNKLLVLDNPERYRTHLRSLEGKAVDIIVRPYRKTRSNNQNRFYWGVVIALLSEHTGYTPDETHDALRLKFLQRHDGPLPTVRSTTELNTIEFEEYLTQVRQLGAEMEVYIPSPNEADY